MTQHKTSTQEIKGTDPSTAEPWCITDTRQMFAAFASLPDSSVVSGQPSIYSIASATSSFFPAWQLLISVLATILAQSSLFKEKLVSLHIIQNVCHWLVSPLENLSFPANKFQMWEREILSKEARSKNPWKVYELYDLPIDSYFPINSSGILKNISFPIQFLIWVSKIPSRSQN